MRYISATCVAVVAGLFGAPLWCMAIFAVGTILALGKR